MNLTTRAFDLETGPRFTRDKQPSCQFRAFRHAYRLSGRRGTDEQRDGVRHLMQTATGKVVQAYWRW